MLFEELCYNLCQMSEYIGSPFSWWRSFCTSSCTWHHPPKTMMAILDSAIEWIISHFCTMFRVAGHLLDHADMHILSVAVACALEAVPKHHGGHNGHNHKLDHDAHFDFESRPKKQAIVWLVFFESFSYNCGREEVLGNFCIANQRGVNVTKHRQSQLRI